MGQKLIVMLTNNDETVKTAKQDFLNSAHIPVKYWGFKDVGLPEKEMTDLVKTMKAQGKTTNLEVISLSEEEGLAGAEIAVSAGFDILMGTVYYKSIQKYLEGTGVRCYPFCGTVYGHPSILDGSMEEIVADAKRLEAEGVDGLDLLSYRYTGDAAKLLKEVVKAVNIPVISAGSIDCFERIDQVKESHADGFTMGSALFARKFKAEGSFAENLQTVWDYCFAK
ncbi:MAG: hypothetical protein LBT26_01170 [Clostridiales Family XIII bacterium]|jgi:sugar phosphate isomerase/epimerase|nr:hypothetical protein [Clostridiales Family XIII bacterium]